MSVDDPIRAAGGGLKDRSDLAGEVEVGVDQPKGWPFSRLGAMALDRGFEGAGAVAAPGDLGTHDGRNNDLTTAAMGFGQQGP